MTKPSTPEQREQAKMRMRWMILGLAMLGIGCRKESKPSIEPPSVEAHSNAEYVRLHHCTGGRHYDATATSVEDGKEVWDTNRGWTAYDCPGVALTVTVPDPATK